MNWQTYDTVVLWVAAVGQVLFVTLFATERWWTHRVGRALMVKSASLALILVATLYVHLTGVLPVWVGRALFTLVAIGILGQLGTFIYERLDERRARREAERIYAEGDQR